MDPAVTTCNDATIETKEKGGTVKYVDQHNVFSCLSSTTDDAQQAVKNPKL